MPGLQSDGENYLLQYGKRSKQKFVNNLGWDISVGDFLVMFHAGFRRACKTCGIVTSVIDEIEDEVLVFVLGEIRRTGELQVTRNGVNLRSLNISSFIYRSCAYGVLRFLRRNKDKKIAEKYYTNRTSSAEHPLEIEENYKIRAKLFELLQEAGCTQLEMEAIRLRYFSGEEKSLREVSEILGISYQAVAFRLERVKKRVLTKNKDAVLTFMKEHDYE